jgi:AcrR family transcriptional regulator
MCQAFRVRVADDTRDRILDRAWDLVMEGGAAALTVGAAARAAGVSRQLVYLHFENRAGLLVAMARRHDRTSGFVGRVLAARELPPVAGLECLVRAWCDYIAEIFPVARALEAAWLAADDGSAAWTDRMTDIRTALRIEIERIDACGRLAPGWTVDDAADWAYMRTHLDAWRHLVVERGWTPAEYVDRLVPSLLGELVREASRNRR